MSESTQSSHNPDDAASGEPFDLLLHSPDGESRGMLERVGDVFPMDPTEHLRNLSSEEPSEKRPFGLRFARVAEPTAGKHEGATKPTSGHPDESKAEETTSD